MWLKKVLYAAFSIISFTYLNRMWTVLSAALPFCLSYVLVEDHYGWATVFIIAGTVRLFRIYRQSLMISSQGRGVLVTGCDTGFGHRLAIKLHDLGFTVFASCLDDKSDGWERLEILGSSTGRLHVIKMDITDQKQVDDARQYVENHLPEFGLWGLVNNAGLGNNVGFLEWVSIEEFERIAAVNLFGAIRVTKAFTPLIRQSQGRITNVSSLLGRTPYPFLGAYCITKHAMEAFSNVLRYEMKRFNVKVCTIEPGNYTSATDIFGKDGVIGASHKVWNNLSPSLKENYGRHSLENQIKCANFFGKMSRRDISPVVNAMADSICQLHPQTHYFEAPLVARSTAYLLEYLPSSVTVPFVSYCQSHLLPLLDKVIC